MATVVGRNGKTYRPSTQIVDRPGKKGHADHGRFTGVEGEPPTLFDPQVIRDTIAEVRLEEKHWLAAGYRLAEQADHLLALVEAAGIDPSWRDADG